MKNELICENTYGFIDAANVPYFSSQETARLIEHAYRGGEARGITGPERAALYHAIVATKLRPGQLGDVQVRDVHSDHMLITTTPRELVTRVELPRLLQCHLQLHLADMRPDDYAFAVPHSAVIRATLRTEVQSAGLSFFFGQFNNLERSVEVLRQSAPPASLNFVTDYSLGG